MHYQCSILYLEMLYQLLYFQPNQLSFENLDFVYS
ncbi:hypothetical protein pb186bvf_012629 [Paramecium bursaria]